MSPFSDSPWREPPGLLTQMHSEGVQSHLALLPWAHIGVDSGSKGLNPECLRFLCSLDVSLSPDHLYRAHSAPLTSVAMFCTWKRKCFNSSRATSLFFQAIAVQKTLRHPLRADTRTQVLLVHDWEYMLVYLHCPVQRHTSPSPIFCGLRECSFCSVFIWFPCHVFMVFSVRMSSPRLMYLNTWFRFDDAIWGC